MFPSASARKVVQKQAYDILSHKCSFIIACITLTAVIVSTFHFGETWLTWSRKKYDSFFSVFSENIVGKSFENELCQHAPIDIVYTWVNGSDPELQKELMKLRMDGKGSDGKTVGSDPKEEQGPKSECGFHLCIPSRHISLKCQLPRHASLISIRSSHASLASVTEVRILDKVEKSNHHWTLISFPSEEAVLSALISLTQSSPWSSQNCSAHNAYWTTAEQKAPFSYVMPRTVLVSGLPSTTGLSHILSSPLGAYVAVDHILLYPEKGVAIVSLPSTEIMNDVLKLTGNVTILGRKVEINRASLILELPVTMNLDDFSPSRFDDKEELRYSLRSVEQFAPWVRHIWLVTNGQIPYWINLEHPKLTLISHSEIFPNKSHLPTFGSPAIESHLHRIPGLSDKFLYLNDDMLFGKEVWPDDFYTTTYGQKVYLSWPVPECHEGCPPLWIGDGYCDRACNHSECHWDGGDCLPGNEVSARWLGTGSRPRRGEPDALDEDEDTLQRAEDEGDLWGDGGNNLMAEESCGSHCTDSWLADKYCDVNCNTLACGFDAGDCGTSHFQDMPAFELIPSVKKYFVPEGALSVYWNLTNLIKSGYDIVQGEYSESKAVRVMALSIKTFTLTLVLKSGVNNTNVYVVLKGKHNGNPVTVDFNVYFSLTKNQSLHMPKGEKAPFFGLKSTSESVQANKTGPPTPSTEKTTTDITPFPIGVRLAPVVLMRDKPAREQIITKKQLQINMKVNATSTSSRNVEKSIVPSLLPLKQLPELKKENRTLIRSLQSLVENKSPRSKLKLRDFEVPRTGFPQDEDDSHQVWPETPYYTRRWIGRRLHDSFADSLLYVNRLYDKAYGLEARKVPAHMAHLIDSKVMKELQARFPNEWDETSSHKVRSSRDMQYAFSYYYFLMSEKTAVPKSHIFDDFDTDNSGTWSDREIRTVLARIYEHPLTYDKVLRFERMLLNCSQHLNLDEKVSHQVIPLNERYLDSKLPVVTKALIVGCHPIQEILTKKFGKHHRFKFQVVGDEEVAFKMLSSDLNSAIAQLDDIRKKPRKFVCLNDNLDPRLPKNNEKVRILLQDLFEALFPKPSSFELPPEYRNRFLKMSELQEWRTRRAWLRLIVYVSIGILILFSLTNFFYSEVMKVWKKFSRHSRRRQSRNQIRSQDITCV
ncbi:N-acetylglucosamine-1-phosphotransferase subunits alpha/beta [Ischnura elegans]|uniref:N-acetylglucosamine-1-phosphotransferase subunits alpha/beta n=1 Tax=Ischnura elegans TaxID=197161 RepID=UPI001ED8AFD6|nr:N-acetylglucosamine-1-phosphotransferase subunits alpha/beta [Ischnura elegans]